MKTLGWYMWVIVSLLLLVSCETNKADDEEIPEDQVLIVNGTAYRLSQAFINYEGEDPLNEGCQYELGIVSPDVDLDEGTGIGEGAIITIITESKGMVEGSYTFDTDPARALNTFSAYVVVQFNLATWERQHFLVVTSGTLDIVENSLHNYTVTLSAKANDIDDDDNVITSNNSVELKYKGAFVYDE
jgi:uncharacterized protein involved in type VI secretion and phage assembly